MKKKEMEVARFREYLHALAIGACGGEGFEDGSEEYSHGLLITMGAREWLRWIVAVKSCFCDEEAGREPPAKGKVFPHLFSTLNLENFAENLDDVAEMRDACRAAGVAFFHKQSAHQFNERGVELDGEILHEYPVPRRPTGGQLVFP